MMDDARAKPAANTRHMLELLMKRSVAAERGDDTAVIWVFRDYQDQWCVRKEGGEIEASFAGRTDAVELARAIGRAWGSYRLFLELRDGRITQELFNLGRNSSPCPR